MSVLTNKTYIITGASKGFGLAISKALLAAGANIGMLARNDEQLQQVVSGLATDCAMGIACDVTDAKQLQHAFAHIKNHFGSLNGVINNAGVARPGSVESIRADDLHLQINTNFIGTVLCCQTSIPLLRGEDNPRIINISSASAWHYDEMLHLSIYAATKAAVERFTRDLRTELQEDGIGVTCIRPGAAWTDFSSGWDEALLTAGIQAWHKVGTTMDTGMETEHVAQAVLNCLSYPAGVAVDLLEIRPNIPVPKIQL
ncbi:SDR family oxidoreductase [Oceanicoccus sp. KOV_DT_Chl]|uniref:SDR family oxidoreductase n=1 Tax=Oceanicoccus sp. KOV_DT_Chl TaxID=1904639 RepID=UPI001358DE56|nr:SDR family oxidoreductase [Oceanicoccus sp. KOV_DT_Chl]